MILPKILIILLAVAISGCNSSAQLLKTDSKQGVEGTVRLKPDYDHSDIYFAQNPPDLTPRPLTGATVYLFEHKYQEIHELNSKDIIDSAITDSLGQYRLLSAPGTYYLAVGEKEFPATVLKYNPQDSIGLDIPINVISTMNIPAGKIITHDFEIHELVAQ